MPKPIILNPADVVALAESTPQEDCTAQHRTLRELGERTPWNGEDRCELTKHEYEDGLTPDFARTEICRWRGKRLMITRGIFG